MIPQITQRYTQKKREETKTKTHRYIIQIHSIPSHHHIKQRMAICERRTRQSPKRNENEIQKPERGISQSLFPKPSSHAVIFLLTLYRSSSNLQKAALMCLTDRPHPFLSALSSPVDLEFAKTFPLKFSDSFAQSFSLSFHTLYVINPDISSQHTCHASCIISFQSINQSIPIITGYQQYLYNNHTVDR